MPLQAVQVVTFDAGGTLLYPYPSVGSIYSQVLAAHGIELHPQALDRAFRRAWKNAHTTARASLDEETEKGWWRSVVRNTLEAAASDLQEPEHEELRPDGLPLPPIQNGSKTQLPASSTPSRPLNLGPQSFNPLFEALWDEFAKPSCWRLHEGAMEVLNGLRQRGYRLAILSNWDRRLRLLLKGLGIDSFFDQIIISSEIGYEKPDPRIFEHTRSTMAVAPERILHVGDSVYHDREGATRAGWHCILITHRVEERAEPFTVGRLGSILDQLPPRPASIS